MYGYQPDFTIPVGGRSNIPAVNDRIDRLRETRKDAEAALRLSKEEMSTNPTPPRTFEVGDKVWLDTENIHIYQASRKLGPRQIGPYEVIERLGDRDYRLKLPLQLKIHNVFHVDRLAPWKGNKVNGNEPPKPAPVIVDGEEQYEVEEILDSRYFRRQFQYYVKWEGFTQAHNTWEPAAALEKDAPLRVAEFHKKHPNAARRVGVKIFATLPWQPLKNYTTSTPPDFSWEEGRFVSPSIEDDGL